MDMAGKPAPQPPIHPSLPTTLRALGRDEYWLQDWIAADPTRFGLRPRTDVRQATKVAIATDPLDRMLGLGRPSTSASHDPEHGWAQGDHTADPRNAVTAITPPVRASPAALARERRAGRRATPGRPL